EVWTLLRERCAELAVLACQAKALAGGRGAGRFAVADGSDLDAGNSGPGLVMELAEIPGADGDAPERGHWPLGPRSRSAASIEEATFWARTVDPSWVKCTLLGSWIWASRGRAKL